MRNILRFLGDLLAWPVELMWIGFFGGLGLVGAVVLAATAVDVLRTLGGW